MACRVKEEMISQLPYTTAISPEDHKQKWVSLIGWRSSLLMAKGCLLKSGNQVKGQWCVLVEIIIDYVADEHISKN